MASADEVVQFTVFDAETGRVLRSGSAQRRDLAAQALGPTEIVMDGTFLADAFAVEIGRTGPVAVPREPPKPAPTAAAVKAEADRRINDRYPVWRQLNLMRGGGDQLDAMSTFIDGVRARSNAIEAMTPIPENFTDDRWWQ